MTKFLVEISVDCALACPSRVRADRLRRAPGAHRLKRARASGRGFVGTFGYSKSAASRCGWGPSTDLVVDPWNFRVI